MEWRRCSSCKKSIPFKTLYWVCNVSTCNRKRTGLVFCTVSCWDAHLGFANHRESWAEERKAPTEEEWKRILSGEDKPVRKRKASESVEETEEEKNPPSTAPAQTKVILRRSNH